MTAETASIRVATGGEIPYAILRSC